MDLDLRKGITLSTKTFFNMGIVSLFSLSKFPRFGYLELSQTIWNSFYERTTNLSFRIIFPRFLSYIQILNEFYLVFGYRDFHKKENLT